MINNMKTIREVLIMGGMLLTTAAIAQTTPANAPRPTTPQSAQQTPVQVEAGQQNSETFNKTEAEKAFNPQNTPVIPGAAVKDTIVPRQSDKNAKDMQKNASRRDSMKMVRKGTREDTTRSSVRKKNKQR
jgi:hypothetical protein